MFQDKKFVLLCILWLKIKRLFIGLLLVAIVLSGQIWPTLADGQISRSEYQIKAVVLLNFLKHVKWTHDEVEIILSLNGVEKGGWQRDVFLE